MAANPGLSPVGPYNHGHGVPADNRLDAPFDLTVAGINRLLVTGDGVDVGRIGGKGDADALFLGSDLQQPQQLANPLFALGLQDVIEGFAPFGIFNIQQIVSCFLCVRCHRCNSSIC